MRKNNKHPTEPENEICGESSENIFENVKYMKKLELQRSILNMLVSPDIKDSTTDKNSDPDSPDSKKSLTNQ
jgi:hypothetical protein